MARGLAVNPAAFYNAEPAPMGIADYGVDPSGAGYRYNTTLFEGELQIGNISTRNASLPYGREFTIQLNVVLELVHGGTTYRYWIQDVADLNTSNNLVVFLDNVWNFSSSGGALPSSSFTGNGTFVGSPSYYYDVASGGLPGNYRNLAYPTFLGLRVVSSIVAGVPEVTYQYNDTGHWVTYDRLAFGWASGAADHGFVVDGTAYNARGLFDDAELILGGPGGGSATEDFGARIDVDLYFWNGHNLQRVLNAYNHGSDTAEGIWNLTARGLRYVSNGTVYGQLTGGAGTLGRLYSHSVVALLNVSVPFPAGEIYLNGTDYGSFVGGGANLTIGPGDFTVRVDRNGATYGTRTVVVPAGAYVPLNFSNATTWPVVFREAGLPAGDTWSVTFGGSTDSGTASTFNFSSANGSATYRVGAPVGYQATPANGTVVVAGAGVTVNVTLQPWTYTVTFAESGLPAGQVWSVTVGGTLLSGTTPNLATAFANGSYGYHLGLVSGWQPSPGTGTVRVAGAPQTITIGFSQVEYVVTFATSGLPPTVHWALAFAGLNYTSNLSLLSAVVPNGSYPFQVFPIPGYFESPSAGVVGINGTGYDQPLNFTRVVYPIWVNLTGLPSGTPWSLALDGAVTAETGGSALVHAPNGTHSLKIADIPGYRLSYYQRGLTVDGAPLAVVVDCARFTYPVTFGATGLPLGRPWTVLVHDGSAEISNTTNGTILAFDLPNGSFSYSVQPPSGYSAAPPSGDSSVPAGAIGVPVTFAPVPGFLAGSVAPASASVAANGTTVRVTDGLFNVSLPPGTYLVHVSAAGYFGYDRTVVVTSGNLTSLRVDLQSVSSGPASGVGTDGWAVVLLAAVVAAIAVIAVAVRRRSRLQGPATPRGRR